MTMMTMTMRGVLAAAIDIAVQVRVMHATLLICFNNALLINLLTLLADSVDLPFLISSFQTGAADDDGDGDDGDNDVDERPSTKKSKR